MIIKEVAMAQRILLKYSNIVSPKNILKQLVVLKCHFYLLFKEFAKFTNISKDNCSALTDKS